MVDKTDTADGTIATKEQERIFLESLEQSGQLADVVSVDEIPKLPPTITHVRFPDGSVERVGFS